MIDIQVLYLFLGGFTIFAFLIGAAAGWWLGGRFGSKRKEKPVVTEPPRDAPPRDSSEILRFVREHGSGALVMELRGKVYHRTQELTDIERNNLMRFGQEWLKWLGAPLQQQAATVENSQSVQPEPEAEPGTTGSESVQPPVAPVENVTLQGKVKPVHPVTPTEDLVASTSIVEQIDEILQELLPFTPLANKIIKLTEDPKQGVAVWVDNQRYVGVDGVPDPDVRALLRKAAQEWEKRSG